MIQFTEKEFAGLMIRFQDECNLDANVIATEVLYNLYPKNPKLKREHQKQTGNSDSAYKTQTK